jgi:hypothetical protein
MEPPPPVGVSRRDLDALRWIGEQYAVRADQLIRLLGCHERTVRRLYARLSEHRLIEVRRLRSDEPRWAIPTDLGLRTAGLPFRHWQPHLRSLSHVAAVTDVRLHVQSRSLRSEWICERTLACKQGSPEAAHLVDAVVLLDGRRIAIEVELSSKNKPRLVAIVEELIGRYDAVLYYCAPEPHRLLSQLAAANGGWPSLGIRTLPATPPATPPPATPPPATPSAAQPPPAR